MDDSKKVMSDSETALSLANEKNRKFLMQLKELTQTNRTITDQNAALTKENTQLKTDLASKITVNEQLVGKVNQFEADKGIIGSLETKIKELQEQVEGNLLGISKLTVACEEKDRRIDLLAHHKQRQQKSDGWWKDGFDGCSDSVSVDSEQSISTLLTESSDEHLSEHRYCPEDVHSMYQRLLSEHVMLERIHSETQFHLLQLKSKIRNDQSMIENLTISLREMREQLRKSEINQEELKLKLDEAQLENEHLEFQILEAQVQNEEEFELAQEQDASVFPKPSSAHFLKPVVIADNLSSTGAKDAVSLKTKTKKMKHHSASERQSTPETGHANRTTSSLTKDLELKDNENPAVGHGHGKKSDLFINNASSRSLQVEEFGEGGHLDVISSGERVSGDSICPKLCNSEVQMMLTPSVQTRGEHGLIFDIGDLEFPERMISSEDLLWKVIEDSGVTRGAVEEKSSEYWKELEERMGLNVDDLALVLEFEDSFPADSEEDAGIPHLTQNSDLLLLDLENGNDALPPPLPKSFPPSEVKWDTSSHDYYDGQHLDNDGGHGESIQAKGTERDEELLSILPKSSSAESGFDSKSYSVSNATNQNFGDLEIQSRNQWNSLVDHNSNSFNAGRENYLNDQEMFRLREQILELETQLTSSQSECLVVLQSNKELKKDLDQTQDIAEDKENELRLLQEELQKLRKRDFRVPAEDQQTQTDLPKHLRDSTSQTTENGNLDKLELLLEAKERELGAKANEADQLSREMREWQLKVALEIEENSKLTNQLESVRKELEAVSEKEVAAKRASEDAAQLIRRLEQQREELRLSVASLEARLEKMDLIVHERDALKQKLMELEHNLEIKNDSESSLLQEVICHKKRVDDLQLSLEEFRGKEFDFETLQTKYEDLGNLTRRLQTAVAPMKARVARLALKCKAKDELMQRLLNELHNHDKTPASLKAEVQRELNMSSTEDYNRPLSPLTISHLDQLNHKILKLDLTLNSDHQLTTKSEQAEFFRIFPESPGNSDAYMSMLNKSLQDQDIRETTISPVGEITRNFFGQHTNNISVLVNSNDTSVINENLKSFSETNSVVVQDVSHQSAKFRAEKPVMNESYSMNSSSSGVKISGRVSNGHFSAEKDHDTFMEEEADRFKGVNAVDVSSDQMLSTGIPGSPSDFRVERLVGAGNVLLSWIPPSMNETSHSHGSVVAGYKVFVNGKESLFLSGPHSTKVLLKSLSFSRLPLHFSIQTVSENGETSTPVETYLDHALIRKFKAADVVESATSDELPMSSVLSSPSQREVTIHRKMFLAIYDYHPTGHPNSKTVRQEELGFQTGDIIVTYGPMRPDGYFVGKVRGRRGLVPGSFLEELAPFTSKDATDISINHRSRNTSSSSNIAHLIGRRSRSVGARLNLTEFRPL